MTELQIEVPAEVTRSTFSVLIPTPYTLAMMTDPAGEPILGVIDTNYGSSEIPVVVN
jgi:hypothetical protein